MLTLRIQDRITLTSHQQQFQWWKLTHSYLVVVGEGEYFLAFAEFIQAFGKPPFLVLFLCVCPQPGSTMKSKVNTRSNSIRPSMFSWRQRHRETLPSRDWRMIWHWPPVSPTRSSIWPIMLCICFEFFFLKHLRLDILFVLFPPRLASRRRSGSTQWC